MNTYPSIDNIIKKIQYIGDDIDTYDQSSLPSDSDETVADLIHLFKESSDNIRVYIRNRLNTKADSWLLLAFAERMSILAVREISTERISDGLLAIVLENFSHDDREDMLILSLLHHSALKINADPLYIFDKAAEISTPECADILKNFARKPKHIYTMGYIEVTTQDGFSYLRTWGSQGDKQTVELFAIALKSEDVVVRTLAAQGLREIAERATSGWIGVDKEEYPDIANKLMNRLAEGLKNLSDIRIIDVLISALKDKNANVCCLAADTLGKIGNERALPYLNELVRKHISRSSRSKRIHDSALAAVTQIQRKVY